MTSIPNVIVVLPPECITNFTIAGNADIAHTKLAQRPLSEYVVPINAFRVWDAVGTNPPASASLDDLALITGTWGTNPVRITAGDIKASGAVTRRIYFSVPIPSNYEDGQTIQVRIRAKMETTIADTTCTIDLEAFVGTDGALSSDLVSSPAQSMNSLAAANYDFTLNPSGVDPGQLIECRLTIASNDAATGTAVVPAVYKVALLCDTRG